MNGSLLLSVAADASNAQLREMLGPHRIISKRAAWQRGASLHATLHDAPAYPLRRLPILLRSKPTERMRSAERMLAPSLCDCRAQSIAVWPAAPRVAAARARAGRALRLGRLFWSGALRARQKAPSRRTSARATRAPRAASHRHSNALPTRVIKDPRARWSARARALAALRRPSMASNDAGELRLTIRTLERGDYPLSAPATVSSR